MNLTVESGSKVLLKTGHLKPVEEGHIKAELTPLLPFKTSCNRDTHDCRKCVS
ncbi:hypothetical protein [Endozoicomonas montiporae]|uniref:hypothetical protein n=1 Tax=Endozoicomonas montiporae TaxID=1027273 RepID=UPI000A487114|nr:hypothetical protein [Endozoicomonas montiporae]